MPGDVSAAADAARTVEFRMPSLGADMESGTLSRWLVKPGDHVTRGDLVAVVETEKSDIDVEIWTTGVVERLLVAAGERVPVGTALALLSTVAGQEPATPPPGPLAVAPTPLPPGTASAERAPAGAGPRVSPAARRRAAELGLDLASVTGHGPHGAIQLDDVERAASVSQAAVSTPGGHPPPTAGDRHVAMRRAITAAVARSNREIPHYYLSAEIPLAHALDWLATVNRERPVTARILPAALLLRAVVRAFADVPEMNGFWLDDAFQPSAAVHLGVMIALRGGGLLAPALRDAQALPLANLMAGLQDLVTRARSGSGLRGAEMTGATISVSNLGDLGTDAVFGVIYPPQVALVGFGRIRERPWAAGGKVTAQPVVIASLAADHRASDGHRGGQFLDAIGRLLASAETLDEGVVTTTGSAPPRP